MKITLTDKLRAHAYLPTAAVQDLPAQFSPG